VRATKDNQSTVRNALLAYMASNKRLPCPATNIDGIEARTAGTPGLCSGYYGLVPYQTLGLSKRVALDGWENFLSYSVSPQWTVTYTDDVPTNTSSNVPAAAFNMGDAGTIQVAERTPATNPTPTANNVAAIVVSHGINGLGAYTSKGTQNVAAAAGTDELANSIPAGFAPPATFVQREYTDEDVPTYGAYDDVVLRLSANDVTFPLVEDGSFKTPEAAWEVQKKRIQDTIVGYMLSSTNVTCTVPTAAQLVTLLNASDISNTDPWGNTISTSYSQGYCSINNTGTVDLFPSCVIPSASTVITYTINTPNSTTNGPTNTEIFAAYNSVITGKCL
jgi:hypothetical protein